MLNVEPWDGNKNYKPGELCTNKGKTWKCGRTGVYNSQIEPGGFAPTMYWEEVKTVMPILEIDEKWSIEYDPENNDRPMYWFRNGLYAGAFDENNAVTAMFYAILEKSQ